MLAAGAKLGPYEISPPSGSGGMGEVYRARDTRLDRTVAIKIIPRHTLLAIGPAASVSNVKRAPFRPCSIPTSAPCMTSVSRTEPTTW